MQLSIVSKLQLPIFHHPYAHIFGFHIVFLHEGVHIGKFNLATEVGVHATVSDRSVWEVLGRIAKLKKIEVSDGQWRMLLGRTLQCNMATLIGP